MIALTNAALGQNLTPLLIIALPIIGGTIAIVVVAFVLYTVIWMGVKRGLEEYYGPGAYRGFTPPESAARSEPEAPTRDRRHRSGRLTR